MSEFRPARSSPPSRPRKLTGAISHTMQSNLSHVSTISVPELMGLSQQEVDILDEVVQRAPPTATTFLTVFKAYNDVLQERGLDQHEVVIYGKLLKLGTLKGKNWGDKWDMIRLQYGYSSEYTAAGASPSARPKRIISPATKRDTGFRDVLKPSRIDDDTYTLHSHLDGTEVGSEADEANHDARQYKPSVDNIPLRAAIPSHSIISSNTLGLEVRSAPYSQAAASKPLRVMPQLPKRIESAWDAETAADSTEDEAGLPSTTPPSYRTALRDPTLRPLDISETLVSPRARIIRTSISPPSAPTPAAARQIVARARERKGSVVNEDDAWKKIKMVQDEKDADEFRNDRLLERCWDVWRQGFEWIMTTNQQIDQARDNLLLRLSLQRWRNKLASDVELHQRVAKVTNNRRVRVAFDLWRGKVVEKRQQKWRKGMRQKMKTIRDKRDGKLRKDAWAKWRQSYRSHLSGQHYTERLVLKFYKRWKGRQQKSDLMESAADEFLQSREDRIVEHSWSYWKKASELRNTERVVVERVGLRIIGEVMDAWKKHAYDIGIADAYHDHIVLKSTLRSWKAARDRIRIMEARALKHVARQDDVLLRAVSRVWKAHERGRLLERVRTVRLVKEVLTVWRRRFQKQKELEDLARAFSMRPRSYVVMSVFNTWRQHSATHQNAQAFALQYHSAQLRCKLLLKWRIKLREKFKMVKQARVVEKFLLMRRAWRMWRDKHDENVREQKYKLLEKQMLKKAFHSWVQRARQAKQRHLAEQIIRDFVSTRILQTALTRWTNKVIELKLRELEMKSKNEITLITSAFKKWKSVCIRHGEELSLMESYQYVKREENISRIFHRWLAVARASRHRRLTLQHKEEELKLTAVAIAWDKWRDRFRDEKLRPIEYDVITQGQRNILFRAFGLWHSKTKSLPAIRFHASHTKSKYWAIWRGSMPRALQAREAREMHRHSVLAKSFKKWVETYKTKVALKAIARARYLRLPTSAPRQVASTSRPALASVSSSMFPRREFRTRSPEREDAGEELRRPIVSPRPIVGGAALTDLSISKSPSEAASSRMKIAAGRTRSPSPTRSQLFVGVDSVAERGSSRALSRPPSSAGGDANRSKLWLELREIKRRSQPPSLSSRAREPP